MPTAPFQIVVSGRMEQEEGCKQDLLAAIRTLLNSLHPISGCLVTEVKVVT